MEDCEFDKHEGNDACHGHYNDAPIEDRPCQDVETFQEDQHHVEEHYNVAHFVCEVIVGTLVNCLLNEADRVSIEV